MKKIVILSLLCCATLVSYGQLTGDFYRNNQNGTVFFMLDNPSPYPISLVWSALNFEKNQQKKGDCILPPYSRLTIGPNEGWVWEAGEYFTVNTKTQSLSFKCRMTDSRVARRKGNITFRHSSSCHIPGHNCPFGIDQNSDGWCDNCMANGKKCMMSKHQ